ncbi:hypothetical protein [Spirosoma areae]
MFSLHSIWSTSLFALLGLGGFGFLLKSVASLVAIYTAGPRIEQAAQSTAFSFDLPESGVYEIAVKRSSMLGVIPRTNSFQVSELKPKKSIPVDHYTFLTSKRSDMSGNRIVPVAAFTTDRPGSFQLVNPSTNTFSPTDRLVIAAKPGFKGVLLILATVFSGIFFIVGLVFFILSLLQPASLTT